MSLKKLKVLSSKLGIQTSYINNDKEKIEASPAALIAMIQNLGYALNDKAQNTQEIIAVVEREELVKKAEAFYTIWHGDPSKILIYTTYSSAVKIKIQWSLTLENKKTYKGKSVLQELPCVHVQKYSNGKCRESRELNLPASLPLGYHTLEINFSSKDKIKTKIIVAPKKLTLKKKRKKSWGVFAPTYALRSERDWGAGDFTDLKKLFSQVKHHGASLVATLPLLPAFLDEWRVDPSPYSPASRLFWNDFYIDPTLSKEWKYCLKAQKYFKSQSKKIARLRKAEYIDYPELSKIKKKIITFLAQDFFSKKTQPASFKSFLKTHPQAKDYARFRATCDAHKASWWCWKKSTKLFSKKSFQYHLYAQYLAFKQLGELSNNCRKQNLDFYLDFPIGVHSDSYDVWKNKNIYALGLSAGAPPDPFFTKGQNWGFPPFHPQKLRESAYEHFIEIVRHHFSQATLLRMDHVMGLHRLYCIPQNFQAHEGLYLRFPFNDLYAILLLEAHRAGASIVGEDLGTVPQEVQESMAQHGLDRLFVFQYEASAQNPLVIPPAPQNAVASLNNHDMPLFSAYWNSLDLNDRKDLGLLTDKSLKIERLTRENIKKKWIAHLIKKRLLTAKFNEKDILKASLLSLAREKAHTLVITLEDLWLENRPQNTPGTHLERPNWKRKFTRTLEALENDQDLQDFFEKISKSCHKATS